LPFFLHAVLDVLPRFGPIFCAIFWRRGAHYIGVLIAVVWRFFFRSPAQIPPLSIPCFF
jgi:hypothetical protein